MGRHDEMLDVITALTLARGIPPSYREIAAEAGCSVDTVYRTLNDLQRQGRIVREPLISRSVRVVAMKDETVEL